MFKGPIIVTGTDTGVGKTIATAALAATLNSGQTVVEAIKLAQTGDDDDAGTIADLAGIATKCLAYYPEPLAPAVAARRCGEAGMSFNAAVEQVRSSEADITLIEGAGGLLVPLGKDDWTVADMAESLNAHVIVVARAGLGTINHTALTLAELERRELDASVVIGSWPNTPGVAEYENLRDIPGSRLGCIPEGAGQLRPQAFKQAASQWIDLGNTAQVAALSNRSVSLIWIISSGLWTIVEYGHPGHDPQWLKLWRFVGNARYRHSNVCGKFPGYERAHQIRCPFIDSL